jgi:peptidoglycan hydrolase-like protein with peptidoglycan-binding domain
MTTRTAAPPERNTAVLVTLAAARAIGRLIAHNPVIAGGTTAFAVSMLFFSSNALWYQPYAQKHTFYSTRPNPYVEVPGTSTSTTGSIATRDVPRVVVKAPSDPAPAQLPAGGDPVVARVQKILTRLKLYTGDIDGLPGPKTRSAIQAYQEIIGVDQSGEIDGGLLAKLDAQDQPGVGIPVPSPAPRQDEGKSDATLNATHASLVADNSPELVSGSDTIVKVQAGLRAFGNDNIELDGVMGAQTQSAIREFQSLFGLQVTGKIDERLVTKMAEVGLIGN